MTIHLTIPEPLAGQLAAAATASASTPERIALAAIERQLDEERRLEESLAPIRAAFKASGMTEDEAVELFEAEKHAMRSERREARGA
jgi:hypothetical protein